MNTENLSTLKIHKLTQKQYDRELKAGRIDENALYLTPYEASPLTELTTIDEYPNCYFRMVDGEREWINPPMMDGVRYCTTERYNNKPVYVFRARIDAPNPTTVLTYNELDNIEDIISIIGMVSANGYCYDLNNPTHQCSISQENKTLFVNCPSNEEGNANANVDVVTVTLKFTLSD